MFEILLHENYYNRFLVLISTLSSQGQTKKTIYKLFLEFHKEIQVNSLTKNDEAAYDKLCDFMDGFTAWGKCFRILPNEPDL